MLDGGEYAIMRLAIAATAFKRSLGLPLQRGLLSPSSLPPHDGRKIHGMGV